MNPEDITDRETHAKRERSSADALMSAHRDAGSEGNARTKALEQAAMLVIDWNGYGCYELAAAIREIPEDAETYSERLERLGPQ